MLEEKDIQRLLRLKRYEKPDPRYYDRFLDEFHKRQRDEMIRTPSWRLALERLHVLAQEFKVPRMAYAGAFSAFVLLAAAVAIQPALDSRDSLASSNVASADLQQPANLSLAGTSSDMNLDLSDRSAFAQESQARKSSVAAMPRYVLDARPVSYDPPFSF